MPMRVPLSLACGAYDRTAALARGDIRPEGVDLTFLALPVEETFFRMTRHREFDAAEMSLSSYLISLDQGAPFVAIPAFVSRAFRHNGIYVGAASGAVAAAGLAGGVEIEPIPAGATLAGMLADGQIDALYTPRVPNGFGQGRVRRLFADPTAWPGTRTRWLRSSGTPSSRA